MSNFDEYFEKQMQDKNFCKEYKALEPQYEIIKQIIKKRAEQDLTQKKLTKKIDIKQY